MSNTLGGEGLPGVGGGVRLMIWLIGIDAPLGPVKLSTSAVVNVAGSTAPKKVTLTADNVPGGSAFWVGSGTRDFITGPETKLKGLLFCKRMAKSPRP